MCGYTEIMSDKYKCLVCDSSEKEHLCKLFSPYCGSMTHPVVICRVCGHIQLDPIFDENVYSEINARFFGRKYLAGGVQNVSNNKAKLDCIRGRLSGYIKSGMKVLDVGAGEAWAMDYFTGFDCSYHAIEPVNRLASSISERGGTVIGDNLFDEYKDLQGSFDIVVFRHALEHMLDPAAALRKLASFLSEDGLLYLVVPNALKPATKKGVRSSWFRPVHISYFCEENLLGLARKCGLEAVVSESGGEIYALLHLSRDVAYEPNLDNYPQIKHIYTELLKSSVLFDSYRLVRMVLSRLLCVWV